MYHCLSKSGSTDWEVTPLPCHTLQTRSKVHNNTLQSKQEIIRIRLNSSAIINNPRPTKYPLNLTQPLEPLCDIPATQTCNCCLLVVDFSTWNSILLRMGSVLPVPLSRSRCPVVPFPLSRCPVGRCRWQSESCSLENLCISQAFW